MAAMRFSSPTRLLVSILAAWLPLGCGTGAPVPPPRAPLSTPKSLCLEEDPQDPCLSALEVERWLRSLPLRVIDEARTSGSSGAQVLTLRVQRPGKPPVTLRAKWREFGDSLLNDVRKEIGAYAAQKVMFRPHEYVVPPTTGRCFSLPEYRRVIRADGEPGFEGISCVFGSLSYWLEDVESSRPFDLDRFRHDEAYRHGIADSNLFTFVIQHGDTHDGNFLVQKRGATTRVYSPDNAIAFNPLFRNPLDWFNPSWYDLRVPALRREVVARLRRMDRSDLDWLAVVEQYRVEGEELHPTVPGRRLPGDEPIRIVGSTLQIGLASDEIGRLHERIREVLQRVDSGDVALF